MRGKSQHAPGAQLLPASNISRRGPVFLTQKLTLRSPPLSRGGGGELLSPGRPVGGGQAWRDPGEALTLWVA